jgi:hypothetical protein
LTSGCNVVRITFFDVKIYILIVTCDPFPISPQSELSKMILRTTVQFPLEALVSGPREVAEI